MNYKIIDPPQYIPEDTYRTYIEKYIRIAKKVKGVIAIYQMGSVSTPGISDIDLIVIVEQKFNPYEYQKLSVKNVFKEDSIANYLFIHDVIVIDSESFKDMEYINYSSNLKLLYGEELSVNKVSEEEKKILGFAISIDFLIMRLHQFEYLNKNNIFLLRGNMVRASSLRHTATIAKNLGLDFDTSILEETKKIRDNWFETKDENSLIEYYHNSITFFNDIVLHLNQYFNKEILLYNEKNYDNKLKVFSDIGKTTIFVNSQNIKTINTDNNKNLYYKFIQELGQNNTIILYPDKLFFHYLTYSKIKNNDVSNKINYLLINNDITFEVDDFYKQTMKKRCESISASIKFVKENRIYFSNSNGYPGFNMLL